MYSIVALLKLWVWCFCLLYWNILLWWPFPDIPNEGDWWVRDRLLPSFSVRGSTWPQVILLSYGLFPTESEWGVGSIHSMKSTAGFSFTTPRYSQIKVCDGWGTVRYHHSMIRKLCFIWFGWFHFFRFLCPMGSWWSSRLSWLDISIWAWEWNSSWKRPELAKLWS